MLVIIYGPGHKDSDIPKRLWIIIRVILKLFDKMLILLV